MYIVQGVLLKCYLKYRINAGLSTILGPGNKYSKTIGPVESDWAGHIMYISCLPRIPAPST